MLEQKTTTNEEFEALCAALLPKFNEYLMRHSKNIFSCELATSLEGIKTMPALYDLNGVQKQVIAPLSLLTKDVDAEIAASKKATKEATTAAAKANDAAASVTKATTDLTVERKKVEDAVAASKTATEAAKKATSDTLASKKAIEQNEATRQSAETARAKAETERATNEAARVEVEKKRVTAENARATAESGRVKAETKRETDAKAAITSSKAQTDLAKELNEHPQKQGENGNWWKWNTTTKQYEDTGIIARGGMMYPTFEILDNELYVTDAGSNIEERIALEDNELILKL
jgi:hypothetical protein|nr:MAG: hypothetical protein [Bacteriophage sp.]